jgi:hypothetical protein
MLVFGTSMVWAQATAQINGTVRDQTGAVLPGVEITATQTDTGIRRNTITDETGSFILPNLATGPYRVEAALPGFRTFVQTGIVLQVNSSPSINAVMEVGQITEQVEVQANAAQVETRPTSVGSVIENERILELPLNGRQATDLIVLAGAAVQTGSSSSQAFQGGAKISIAGGLSSGVNFALDGAMHNNPYDGTNQPLPFPDALQEFKVETTGVSAGSMKSGGAVNAVTKSGTNELHGNAFWFVRNYLFNARNAFAASRDSLKRNQFGGTLGGPIVQNKLFFFGGYQRTTTREAPTPRFSYVPTPSVLAGDFRTMAASPCQIRPATLSYRDATGTQLFTNNTIDPARFDRVALNIAAKLPKSDHPCGEVQWSTANTVNEGQAVGRIDYQVAADHSIFGRYVATTYLKPAPFSQSDNILTTVVSGFDNLAQSYAVGDTYLFGPETLNAFRLTVNRTAVHRTHEPFFNGPDVGINMWSGSPSAIQFGVTSGFNIGGNTQTEAVFNTTSYQLNDDVSMVAGNHQIAFGGTVAHWRVEQSAENRAMGALTFDGTATGLGMADFLLGRLTTLDQGSTTDWSSRTWYFGAFAEDTWRMTPRLTTNLGLRWEPFLPMALYDVSSVSFDQARFDAGIKSSVFPNAPAGFYYPGDQGFPGRSGLSKRWNNLGPRLGLAWDVQGDGRTSLRASYGIAYDLAIGSFLGNSAANPPNGFRTVARSPSGGLANPWSDFPGGNPFPWVPSATSNFLPFATFITMNSYDMKTPSVQSWNLSLQRQVTGDSLLSVSYLGRQSTHLWVARAVNSALYAPGATTGNVNVRRRLYLQNRVEGGLIGNLTMAEDGGTSTYHGLLLSVQHRPVRGVNINGNYTWSHCIGDGTGLGSNLTENTIYLNPNNRDFDRGNCDSDRRHSLNLTAVAETPEFASPAMRVVASGWRVSGIYRHSTGQYLTITNGRDLLLDGTTGGNQRPNQILGSPYGDKSSLDSYLNRAAFAFPASGTMGNIGRGNILGPSTWQFDMALSRIFRVGETQRMEFRAEAFNLTNSVRRGNPTTTLSQSTFGRIQSADDPRIMQFALKYIF